ncbi:MAG: chemotaxis protein CheW [Thermoanaerobaculia bacterium]|nr:chemotaxis protein CheW [Thermoanaerobaculia bacterium]
MHSGFQELLEEFLLEAKERADEVEATLLQMASGDADERQEALAQAKRELHTLKGNAGMMGFSDLQHLAHEMEDDILELDLDAPEVDGLLKTLDLLRGGLDEIQTPEESAQAGAPVGTEAPEATLSESGLADAETVDGFGEPIGGEPGGSSERGASARDVAGSVRVSFSKIDQLVEVQAETLIARNRLADAIEHSRGIAENSQLELPDEFVNVAASAWEDVEDARQNLEKTLRLLQELVTDLGMVPLQGLFRSLSRIVHDESRREGKKIDFEIRGGNTPIDKTLLEAAGDALGHVVRNAVIHGIETPDSRRAAGKDEQGVIQLSAAVDGSEVRIEVTDDGAGIDTGALRKKARSVAPELAAGASDLALLFEEGVSTRKSADLAAGRGVGMAAVKRSVEAHGGRIKVQSEPGMGTSFALHLPVSASILRSLLLTVDGEDYALPLTAVTETLLRENETLHEMNRAAVVRWRHQVLPLLDLGDAFETATGVREKGFIIVVDVNGRLRGLVADRLVGIRDIVVKGLDRIVGQPSGISGSTILGDGRVIMILDPAGLVTIPPSAISSVHDEIS